MSTCVRAFEMGTPIGTLYGALRGSALCALGFDEWSSIELRLQARFGPLYVAAYDGGDFRRVLTRYFDGHITEIDELAVDLGGTRFEQTVWAALRRIPAGDSTAYGRLARHIGAPRAARAVGAANGRNPVAIVVPCHRVIHEDGTLSGYAGGVERKRWLLSHEARHARPTQQSAQPARASKERSSLAVNGFSR